MATPQHGIDIFNFEFWRGPAPGRVQDHGRVFTRPGTNNIGLQTTGIFGQEFTVELTAWFEADGSAHNTQALYAALPWSGWLALKYNDVNYTLQYGLGYHALSVETVRIKRIPFARRSGIGGAIFSPCDVAVSRWTLLPEFLSP
jgi:hypothetical protein